MSGLLSLNTTLITHHLYLKQILIPLFLMPVETMKIHAIAALVLGASALKIEQKAPPCVYLDETQAELDNQVLG